MIKRLAEMTYIFLIEFILAILCSFNFFIPYNALPPILILIILSFGGFISFIFLVERFGNKGKLLYLLIVFPLLLIVGSMGGFRFLSLIVIGILVLWRGNSIFINHSLETTVVYLFYSFMVVIWLIIFSGIRDYPYQNVIVGIMIFQIILVLMGLFFSNWNTINDNRGKFILFYGGIFGGIGFLGLIISFGLNQVQFIFSGLATLVVKLVSFLVIPLLYAVQFVMKLLRVQWHDLNVRKVEPVSAVQEKAKEMTDSGFQLSLTVLLIAAGLVAVYYIYKKRRFFLANFGNDSLENEEFSLDEGEFLTKKRVKPPKDLIRSEIFHLQKFAHKMKMGRRPFESLTDWWNRIGINANGELLQKYENVRYGENPSSPEDLAKVKAEIAQIKQQIKENKPWGRF